MAQEQPEWEIMADAEAMIKKMVENNPSKFGHIDAGIVGVAAIANKPKPEGAEDCKIKGVKEPESLWSSKQYVIFFHKDTWDKYNKAQRSFMLAKMMLRISDECDGKVMPEDLKDMVALVKGWGVNYMTNPNIPDLSEEKQAF